MQQEKFKEKFLSFCSDNKLLKQNGTTLLAVSGGIDSIVMLELFHQSKLKFGIAHCNFQLREKDSDEDSEFVKNLAKKYDVSYYEKRFNTIVYQKENKLSVEEAARELRYAWLNEIRLEFGYQSIATAHHLNDSIETIILNLSKGTGIKGIQGIPVKNNFIIRPLLFATRNEIENFSKKNNLNFRIDKTNLENDFQRNKIRNHVIPVLKEINPSLEKAFEKNIRHFNDIHILYQQQVRKKLLKIIEFRKDAIYVSIQSLRKIPASATYLFEIINQYGFSEAQCDEINKNMFGSGKQFLSLTHRVIIDRKFIIITPILPQESEHIIIEKEEGHVKTKYFKLDIDFSTYNKGMQFNTSGSIAYFDADKIEFPLTLRVWKKGDYMYPLGLYKKQEGKNGHRNITQEFRKPAKKKVSDILINMKVDLFKKENTYVLLQSDKILWLVGLRQDERFKVTDKTKTLIKIKMLPL